MRSPVLLATAIVLSAGAAAFHGSSQHNNAVLPQKAPAAWPAQPSSRGAEAIRLNNLGTAYMNQQQFERGLKYFQQGAAADPELLAAQVNTGIALVNLQRTDEAKQLLDAVLKKAPNNTAAWYNLGLLYKNQGDAQPALE